MDLQLFADSAQERTEQPTPRRLEEARKKGQVARSVDLSTGLSMLAAALLLRTLGPHLYRSLQEWLTTMLQARPAADLPEGEVLALFRSTTVVYLRVLAPLVLVLLGVGVFQGMAQTRLLFTGEPLIPKLERLNPLNGFRRIFSRHSLVELLKSVAKVALLFYIAYLTLRDQVTQIPNLMAQSPAGAVAAVADTAVSMLLRIGLVLLVIGGFDYLWQWWNLREQLMMTKEEVKEELKETEGRPEVRQRLRQKQREMAMQRRSLKNVPQATAVITNPTHFAVAIRYEIGKDPAPIVVAKGMDVLARRIKEIAQQHDVPTVENPPLARALYREVNIGETIPKELYQAVAEVLAFVYRLKRQQNRP